ncbi:MAG: carbamoyl-phosphate synthase (glutamine-hydrolyzing) small subunit [Deltaproteobacteria bacterium CG07_land_8_20_14_0_80_38_7]|nr:MAG: carbamoyl-phosphate synthase (glutamine-hydrolyzing) small subunit [Deltaproteobacteria bacterium CG07_land_8_20_14_0_80_38_7]
MLHERKESYLILEDGSIFTGFSFGADGKTQGEVVFNTGMVGYPEAFTDPSYRNQILVLTYPLIGNYGVPAEFEKELSTYYESKQIHLSGLVVSEYSKFHHHWTAVRELSDLLIEQNIVGIEGIDTRALTKKLREHGTMQGYITDVPHDSFKPILPVHPVLDVSVKEPKTYGTGNKRIAVIDCGCKNTIIRSLLARNVTVIRVPWNYDVTTLDINGVLFSNGPGNPEDCMETINTARKTLELNIPTMGICLGNQIIGLASGAKTYKLKYGHRSQNQPCLHQNSKRCYITSQNHGYAIDRKTLSDEWEELFINANDGTNEGLIHKSKPVFSVQFHPEAMPGPVDTGFLFDKFISMLL